MKKYAVDLYPAKAQFYKNENIGMEMELYNSDIKEICLTIEVRIMELTNLIEQINFTIEIANNEFKIQYISISPQNCDFQGFGVDVYISLGSELIQVISSSFDVVSTYKKSMRYGFLSDFYSKELGELQDIKSLRKLHINLVQFYDWMYKHEDLIPKFSKFNDLMGRELSFDVVKEKIKACHCNGMKAIAYGAVYAASKEFYEKNKDYAFYDSNDNVISFINIFQIMNISEDCPWHWHIINQYKRAIEVGDFDGIHMDTYGFPKTALSKLNGVSKVENLEYLFPSLINHTKEELQKVKQDICIIFNNVGNWPLNTVAKTNQEAVYIEVWKPYERYHHLKELILWAKHLSDNKPVILAAYLSPFKDEKDIVKAEISALITTAVIFSNGGYHLLMGEKNGVLTQGYYVDYSTISDSFYNKIRKYYDFQIRYMNILYDNELRDVTMTHVEGDNIEYTFGNLNYSTYGEPNKVWIIVKEKPKLKLISFINLSGNCEDYWNKGKNMPVKVINAFVNIAIDYAVKDVFIASPDSESQRPEKLEYKIEAGIRGKRIKIKLNELNIWSVLCIMFE